MNIQNMIDETEAFLESTQEQANFLFKQNSIILSETNVYSAQTTESDFVLYIELLALQDKVLKIRNLLLQQ